MSPGDEQIRVSRAVKRELERRRRENETLNDVLERILDVERNLLSGAGFWSDDEAERVREGRGKAKEKSKERTGRLSEDSNE